MATEIPPDDKITPEDIPAGVENQIRMLADLTTDQVRTRPGAVVPPEAVDFVGAERAAMNEKIRAITDLGFKAMDAINEPHHRKALEETIKTLVSASSDPGTSMALISRIWAYLEKYAKTPYDKNDYSPGPNDFRWRLETYAKQKGLDPLSHAEEYDLCRAIKEWKDGKPPEQILKMLEYSISAAYNRANPPTRFARQVSRNRGEDRVAMNKSVRRMQDIKTFLTDLFRQSDAGKL